MAVGLAITAFFAWLCFKERISARDTGKFIHLPRDVNEKDSPLLFQTCKVIVTIQAYFFTMLAAISGIALITTLIGAL